MTAAALTFRFSGSVAQKKAPKTIARPTGAATLPAALATDYLTLI